MRKFAQYLEERDPRLHVQIIDEGIVGDAAKWVGDKAKGAWQGAKDFFGEFMSRLKEQFGDFKTDMNRLKQLDKEHKLDQMKRDIDEAERLGNEEHKKEVRKRWFKWLVTAGVILVTALTVSAGHAHGGGPLDGPLVKHMPDKTGDSHGLDGIQKTIADAKGSIHNAEKVGFMPLKSFEKLGQEDSVTSGIKWELKNMDGKALLKFKNALGEEGEFSKIFNHTVQKSGVKEAISVANELSKVSKIGSSDAMEMIKILKSEISKDASLKNSPEFQELIKSFSGDITQGSEYTKSIEGHIKKDKADSEMSAKERAKRDEKDAKNQAEIKKAYDQDAKDSEVKRQEKEKIKDEILKTGSSDIIQKIHDSPKSVVKSLLQREVDNMIIKTFKEKGDEAGLQLANMISMKGGLESIKSRQQADEYGNMRFTSGPEFVKQSVKKLGSSPKTMADLDRIYKGGQDGSNEKTGMEWGKKNNLPSYYEESAARRFAQYLEERDPALRGQIVDEDVAKWFGDKAKVVLKGAKKKLQSAKNFVQSAKNVAGEAGEALKGMTDRWAAKRRGGYEYESNPENW